MTSAFEYVIKNHGIDSNAAYPYTGKVSHMVNACLNFEMFFKWVHAVTQFFFSAWSMQVWPKASGC